MGSAPSTPRKASAIPSSSHGKTEVLRRFTGSDFGPLRFRDQQGEQSSNHGGIFKGSCYVLSTALEGILTLYRVHGKQQFTTWTLTHPPSTGGTLRSLSSWSALEAGTLLKVPKGIFLLEGIAATSPEGDTWIVFIPDEVLSCLLVAQKERSDEALVASLDEAFADQRDFYDRYETRAQELNEAIVREVTAEARTAALLTTGNQFHKLPSSVQKALRLHQQRQSNKSHPIHEGTHVLHTERVRLPNGTEVTLTLTARFEFQHESRSVGLEGNAIVDRTVRSHKVLLQWK